MIRSYFVPLLSLAAALLGSGDAHSQARGPSHKETREKGKHIVSSREFIELKRQQAREQEEQERIALLNPAIRAESLARLDAFLRILPGRYRIDGRIVREMDVEIGGGVSGAPRSMAPVTRSGAVTGIADCSAVGDGVGLNCIISASWPIFDKAVRSKIPLSNPMYNLLNPPRTFSEQLNTMHPSVLVVGLSKDPPRIRSMLVTADTLAHNWVGKLDGNSAKLTRPGPCLTAVRCYQTFEIVAEPDGDIVSFNLYGAQGTVAITLSMYRDWEANE